MSNVKTVQASVGVVGIVTVEHFDENLKLKRKQVIRNKVTTAGDEYLVKKTIQGISPANPAAPTAANGMKLGTGVTAPSKSGAGAALGAYITGSNVVFDAAHPVAAAVGGDTGWKATYKTTWGPGVATNSAITEVVLVNDQTDNTASTAAETYGRSTFTAVNKAAGDTLVVTWEWVILGA